MTTPKFKVGDIVRLIQNSPNMVVERIWDTGYVELFGFQELPAYTVSWCGQKGKPFRRVFLESSLYEPQQ